MLNKVKIIINSIIKIVKTFILSIFNFFISLFNKNKFENNNNIANNSHVQNSEIKPNVKDTYNTSIPEEPTTRKFEDNYKKSISISELEKLIFSIYCEEIGITYNNLNNEQILFFNHLKEKILEDNKLKINQEKEILKKEIRQIIKTSLNKNTKESSISNSIQEKDNQPVQNLKSDNIIINNENKAFSKSNIEDNSVNSAFDKHEKTYQSLQDPKTNNFNLHDNGYKYLEQIHDYFLVKTLNNTYVLVDIHGNVKTSEFKDKIYDYKNGYLTIFKNNRFYIYKRNGDRLDENDYLYIDLKDQFYIVITDDYKEFAFSLDIKKYNDKNFKLSHPIEVNNNFTKDYEIKNFNSGLEIKIKSSKQVFNIDIRTGQILNELEKSIDTNTPHLIKEYEVKEEPEELKNTSSDNPSNISSFISENETIVPEKEEDDESLLNTSPDIRQANEININTENITEIIKKDNDENKEIPLTKDIEVQDKPEQLKRKEEKEEPKKEEQQQKDTKDFSYLNERINVILNYSKVETQKEELEDKNYEELEEQLNSLLEAIANEKKKTTNQANILKLNKLELETEKLKTNLQYQKNTDINREKDVLESSIHTSELYGLQTELKNIYLDNKKSLKEVSLENLEDLNSLDFGEANEIQKKLLLNELKKAAKVTKKTHLLNLPFIRNRYFRLFASGMLVKNHLKMYENILKRKNAYYRESNFNNMVNENVALNGALSLNVRNLNRLNYLEEMTKERFPDLAYNQDYILYVNNLKNNLLSQEEKILRKKKMIKKYNLDSKVLIRKRKKESVKKSV